MKQKLKSALVVIVVILIQAVIINNVNAQTETGLGEIQSLITSSFGAQFIISEVHYTNEKYFSAGQTVTFDGVYSASEEGVMVVNIQYRPHEKSEWKTVEELVITYDNQIHWNSRREQYMLGRYHKAEINIEKGGEYRVFFNNENSDLTMVLCTDVRLK